MKQIIQNYRSGKLELAEVPLLACSSNTILVKNVASLVSIGTERSVIELGQKSLLGKAKQRPDLVRRFMDKAKKEGLLHTFQEALNRLDSPTPLGYSSAGVVIEVGENIHRFSPGDRVSCIGAGYASHAEYIAVPENLCCKIPDNLTYEEASFGMLGIIALHGIRCAKLTFGSTVAVIGLGLLGLLTVQILRAYGCRVMGTDIDPTKLELGKKAGADIISESSRLKDQSELFSNGSGVDAVILTVATKSDEPMNAAVDIARSGGRVVLVGVADIHPQRNEMWHKEVELIVSKGGGAGTLDPFYENKGIDYPIGYVRWTENRNLEEFLRLIAEGDVDVKPLVSHRFKIEDAEKVYGKIINNLDGPYIGVVLEYPDKGPDINKDSFFERAVSLRPKGEIENRNEQTITTVGVIGAGLFGKAVLMPILKNIRGVRLKTLATSSSPSAHHMGKKGGFERCTTDYHEILEDNDVSAVIILTPHGLHANMVCEALKAGKHVFVEKPLCINLEQLKDVTGTYMASKANNGLILTVGYNRRFSLHSEKIREYFERRQDPMIINYRVNPGYVPPDHWVHSEEEGGSRVIGEMCHFVDLMQFLTGSNPVRVYGERVSGNNRTSVNSDNVAITIKFADGSVGNLVYSASGDRAFTREQFEIFCEGSAVVMSDFKQSLFYKAGKKRRFKTANQNMGYKEELEHYFKVVNGNQEAKLTPLECFLSTLAVFNINESLDKANPIDVNSNILFDGVIADF
jgi:predicted dehydrogenase/NADPH:quinone reductase-like Zn-dependent oxidoreductase